MGAGVFIKDPDGIIVYTEDWTDWLGALTIATVVWTFEPATTPALAKDSQSNTTKTASAQWSGGKAGTNYLCTGEITTADGQREQRSFILKVRDKQ